MKTGADVINEFMKAGIDSPGVYQFLNKKKEIIYIGKAKNINKRLSSYLKPDTVKTQLILRNLSKIIVLQTGSEYEALILEANFIKKIKPKYNIVLKDDKSFPYIVIDESHDFPRIIKYRGKDLQNKIFYGPFPYAKSIDKAIEMLQKIFLLRSCSDMFFKNRKVPCMLYQVKQCSAPCVGKVSVIQYKKLVGQVRDFLSGRSKELYASLFQEMNKASQKEEYEIAAKYRDRIHVLSKFVKTSSAILEKVVDIDVVCFIQHMDKLLIQISFVRLGSIAGHKGIEIAMLGEDVSEVLRIFISNFYLRNFAPNTIVIDKCLDSSYVKSLESFLKEEHKKDVRIITPLKGAKKKLLAYCFSILNNAHAHALQSFKKHQKYIIELAGLLSIPVKIQRIEIFDNSHCFGSNAVGAIVVCGTSGFNKKYYRRYNMNKSIGSDDYAMLYEVLTKRFISDKKMPFPDLMIIDGGKGHLKVVLKFLASHGIDGIKVIGVAKGKNRNSGNEIIYTNDNNMIMLEKTNQLKQYIQLLRDEAHRFAISGYRKKALSSVDNSVLDNIPGVGAIRKRQLLSFFGSIKNLSAASLLEIEKVPGIDKNMSKLIYKYINQDL